MPPNGVKMSGSMGRIERTGPTALGRFECHTATSRVRPPSTISSNTMSVEFRPSCGLAASDPLSILQATEGRESTKASLVVESYCRPVSGAVTYVGVGDSDGDALGLGSPTGALAHPVNRAIETIVAGQAAKVLPNLMRSVYSGTFAQPGA